MTTGTQIKLKQGLYFYDTVYKRWVNMDEAPFILMFSPGGGEFTRSVVPEGKIISAYKKNTDGEMVDITSQLAADLKEFSPFIGYELNNGTYVYMYTYDAIEAVEFTLGVRNIPTQKNEGLTPPPGFDDMDVWEVTVPYHKFDFNSSGDPMYDYPQGGTPDCFAIKMTRPNIDGMRQAVALPHWRPSRDDRLRCIVTTSGVGSLDFGNIQSVDTTYNSRLTVIPIVCYGYTGSYCMDLGVTKTVNITYTRVNPDVVDNTSADSRRWDNATWYKKLKEITNRWQMRTNGSLLYLKRPDAERLSNGEPGYYNPMSPEYKDPMRDYIEEIEGENCYISSSPMTYPVGKPMVLQSSVTFMMGTLYPKQVPYDMIQLTFTWRHEKPDDPGNYEVFGRFYISYPRNSLALAPQIPATWALKEYPVGSDTYWYPIAWQYPNDDDASSYKTLGPGEAFDPTGISGNELYVVEKELGAESRFVSFSPGTYTLKLKPNVLEGIVQEMTVFACAVGGGGGGGPANAGHGPRDCPKGGGGISDNNWIGGGGGGGASGGFDTYTATSTNEIQVECHVGAGGKGAQSSAYWDEPAGTSGDGVESYVTIGLAQPVRVTGVGGKGGEKCSISRSDGIDGLKYSSEGAPGGEGNNNANSFAGGNGGRFRFSIPSGFIPIISAGAESGQDGSATNVASHPYWKNGGGGGTGRSDTGKRIIHSGGGGGGGAILPEGVIYTGYSTKGGTGCGEGLGLGNDRNGGIGCGGGGGGWQTPPDEDPAEAYTYHMDTDPYIRNGGNGGDGMVLIIVQNGSIETDEAQG